MLVHAMYMIVCNLCMTRPCLLENTFATAMDHKSFQDNQRKAVMQFLMQPQFCDVTFLVGEERKAFSTNRIFLASMSSVFNAMLYGQMQEGQPNAEIELTDITADAFQVVLDLAQCTKAAQPKLSPETIVDVKAMVRKYQMTSLVTLTDRYFAKCLTASNLCQMLAKCNEKHLDSFVEQIRIKIKKVAGDAIVKSAGFLVLICLSRRRSFGTPC